MSIICIAIVSLYNNENYNSLNIMEIIDSLFSRRFSLSAMVEERYGLTFFPRSLDYNAVFNWKNITGFIFPSNNKRQNRNEVEISKNIVDSKAKQSVKSGDIIYFKPLGISATIKFNSIGNVLHININGQDLSFSKSSPII